MTQENMLARYKVLHELGRGAMGAVYAARDRDTGGVVALKRLDPALLSKSDANFAGRFLKHARSARLLTHRNIVKIHDAGEVGGTVYVAMEMLEGESLGKILREPLPIARAIQIARDIACGLAHAHLEGVVHGGLKPSNIIVSRSGAVKIIDFGTAGSLRYLSPEQLRGDPVDHRCDIFSLGALFYEMLTHRAPFAGDSAKEILENIRHAKPPLPSELNPHVPRVLDAIVFSMLAGQPAARMSGVPILLRDLQGLEKGLGLASGQDAGANESPASVPPAEPEPRLRTPDPDRGARNASELRIRADSSAGEELQRRDPSTDGEAFDDQKAIAMMERESRRERSSGPRSSRFAALAIVLAVIGIGLGGFAYHSAGFSDRGIVASARDMALAWLADRSRHARAARAETARAAPSPSTEEAPARAHVVPRAIAPAPVADATHKPATVPAAKPTPPTPLAPKPGVLAQTDSTAARAPAPSAPDTSPPLSVDDGQAETESSGVSSAADPMPPEPVAASAGTTPAPALPRTKQPAAEVPQQHGGTARVILSVSPRGEIYIDGKHHGTTPPITTFDLEPGMHRIEVRSGSRTPYLTYVTLETGDVRRIRHDFDVSRAVYPPKSVSWQRSNRAAR